jgi:hypothetical protein
MSVVCVLCLTPAAGNAAIVIDFNYDYDTGGFFSDPARKAVLNAAADVFEARMTGETFSAITPSPGNSLTLNFDHPSTGTPTSIVDPTIAANTLTIYVGAQDLAGSTLGIGGPVGWGASGSIVALANARNTSTNFDPLAGMMSFDTPRSWYFDSDVSTLEDFSGMFDFYSVALHELGHVLGFGTSAAFTADVSAGTYTGAAAVALHGGAVPLHGDSAHFQSGLLSGGNPVLMDPSISSNTREIATDLDFAVFSDIGYSISAVPEASSFAAVGLVGALAGVWGWISRRRLAAQ